MRVSQLECETCGQKQGEWHRATEPKPTLEEPEEIIIDSVCPATDGCTVEPDGICSHGHQAWLLELGLI